MSKQTVVIRPPVTIKFDGDKCEEECFDSFATGTHICSAFACLPIEKVVVRVEGNVAFRCQACLDAVREANEQEQVNMLLETIQRISVGSEKIINTKDALIKESANAIEAVMFDYGLASTEGDDCDNDVVIKKT